jgi:hypothetical protein
MLYGLIGGFPPASSRSYMPSAWRYRSSQREVQDLARSRRRPKQALIRLRGLRITRHVRSAEGDLIRMADIPGDSALVAPADLKCPRQHIAMGRAPCAAARPGDLHRRQRYDLSQPGGGISATRGGCLPEQFGRNGCGRCCSAHLPTARDWAHWWSTAPQRGACTLTAREHLITPLPGRDGTPRAGSRSRVCLRLADFRGYEVIGVSSSSSASLRHSFGRRAPAWPRLPRVYCCTGRRCCTSKVDPAPKRMAVIWGQRHGAGVPVRRFESSSEAYRHIEAKRVAAA